jgi:uncharacterized protein with HEPN domain
MSERDRIRFQHMLDAAREAFAFAAHRGRHELSRDRALALALVKEVEIIGEAASQISPALRQSLPNIPWSKMIGMRNRLIHAYSEIDLEVLWDTIETSLPPLVSQLESALRESEISE